MRMWSRRRLRNSVHSPEVNVIPLIDVSLMLLVVFMVTMPMLKQGIKVELPQGKSQETKDASEELVIYIDKKSAVFFNDKQLSLEALIAALAKRVPAKSDKTIFVKADRAVNYGKVIEVVDRIKQVGGIKYVALATTSPAAAQLS